MKIAEKLEPRLLFTTLTLDPDFGSGGIVSYHGSIYPTVQTARGVQAVADDQVMLSGTGSIAAARFTASGSLDSHFIPADTYNRASDDTVVQSDGKLVVAIRDDTGISLQRFTADGYYDGTFANSSATFYMSRERRARLAIDPEGKMLLATVDGSGDYHRLRLSRFAANGELESTDLIYTVGHDVMPADVAFASDGDIVLLGHVETSYGTLYKRPVVVRMNAPNNPDYTFGPTGAGYVDLTPDPDGASSLGRSLIVTPSNGIYVAGTSANTATLWNLSADGNMNADFGSGGRLVAAATEFAGRSSFADVIADGTKLYAAGETNYNGSIKAVLLGIYTLAGAADTQFDGDGLRKDMLQGYASGDSAEAMTFDSQGRLLIAGQTSDQNWMVARYTVSHPPPFSATASITLFDDANGDGYRNAGEAGLAGRPVSFTLRPFTFDSEQVTVQTDSNGVARLTVSESGQVYIVVAPISGKKATSPPQDTVDVWQSGVNHAAFPMGFRTIPANTQLDPSYGTSGLINFSGNARAARFTDDGKVYIALANGNVERRSATTGALDPTWGTGGVTQAIPNALSRTIYDVLPQPDGKVLVASQNGDIFIYRLLANGALDTSFAVAGVRQLDFGANEFTPNLALGPNGTIIVAAERQVPSANYISSTCIARLLPNGNLDASFDGDGMQTYKPAGTPGWYYRLNTLVVQNDGKILFAAQQDNAPSGEVIVRVNTNGTLDTSFADGDGIYTLPVVAYNAPAVGDLMLDASGRILFAGHGYGSSSDTSLQMVVGRLTPTGAIDSTFGTGGTTRARFTLDLAGSTTVLSSSKTLAIAPDGSIVVAGRANTTASSATDAAVLYLRPDGTPDTAFGTGGLARMAASSGFDEALAVTVGADRKPVILFIANTTSGLARFNVPLRASISGTVYNDLNNNATQDTGELGLAGRTVYIDADYDGVLDANESRTTTDASGAYQIGGLSAGSYAVRQVLPARWSQTAPTSNNAVWMTLAAGQTFTNANLGSRNTGGPALLTSSFQNETKIAIDMTWEESVAATLDAADLSVINSTTNAVLSSSFWTLTVTGSAATVQLLPTTPDGNYFLQIRANGVASSSGVTNPSLITLAPFFIFAGDVNRDRAVNFDDLLVLAQNYGQTGRTFSQGNINYSTDGKVDFDDLLLLAQRYGTSLAVPAAPAVRAAKKAVRRDVLGGGETSVL